MAINVDRVPERERARWLAALTRRLDFDRLPDQLLPAAVMMYEENYRVDVAANRLKSLKKEAAASPADVARTPVLFRAD